jgi:putative transposase
VLKWSFEKSKPTRGNEMRKKRFNEHQIMSVLRENESGIPVPDLSRKYGVSESTIFNWKSKYAGMSLSDIKKLKHLEQENRRLKQMYATLSMDHELLKEVLEKKYNVDLSEEI